MSFNFGQFRRSQVSNYLTPISHSITDLKSVSAASAAMFFSDKIISLSQDNPLISVNENNIQQSYFLRVKIYKRSDSNQIITIKLNNTDKVADNIQNIRQIEIPKGAEEEYTTFEIVISPNNNYNEIQFILQLKDSLAELGFDIDTFGENKIIINAVPMQLKDINLKNFVDDLLHDMKNLKPALNNEIRNYLMQKACKSSVKSGQTLSDMEIKDLLKNIDLKRPVLLCPHGRPIFSVISKSQIEKCHKSL